MKKRKILLTIAIIAVLCVAAIPVVKYLHAFHHWSRKYNQAERLVPIVWPMSSDIQDFNQDRGAFPTSLAELVAFSGATQCLSLAQFPHEFSTGTGVVFRMMVNEMFGFTVNADGRPDWIWPTDEIWTPTTHFTLSSEGAPSDER